MYGLFVTMLKRLLSFSRQLHFLAIQELPSWIQDRSEIRGLSGMKSKRNDSRVHGSAAMARYGML